ncbi:hypothetical protein [Actinopolymorpha pittospori]|uniref:Uncharacterized protein n=1 Tax=Actinopolymorpha pittospori TaxID=648752 RepID=A0A927RIM0_9ACTN|nr:hypothetical protein [Actinopolymorpha pittospori]MBE1606331.1 hypothetical protein [Actinopolymorpha pittospori]
MRGTWDWHDFYNCDRVYLSYWSGAGLAYNNETGGAVSYLYGQSGQRIGTIPPDGYLYAVNWGPVWSIGV